MICPDCKGKGGGIVNEVEIDICPTCGGTGQSRDPYLVPGQVCEVWNGDALMPRKELRYFSGYGINGELLFRMNNFKNVIRLEPFEYYRPHGTEWDSAPTKETHGWDAVCSTVDESGIIRLWKYDDIKPHDDRYWFHGHFDEELISVECGICPDKSRYENGAWMNSLRERPFWAGVKR